ncbi:MAG: radical SAM protein [Pseudomonadota bacterium]
MVTIDTTKLYERIFGRRKNKVTKFDSTSAQAVTVQYFSEPILLHERGVLQCAITLRNGSAIDLNSSADFPVRLVAFIVSTEESQPYLGDFARYPLPVDVKSHSTRSYDLTVALPESPGSYVLAVTLVQEGVMWLHLCNPNAIATHLFYYQGHPKWWSESERSQIVYGHINELNQLRLKPILGCGTKKRPLMLHCETVNICNFRCVICPYNEMTRQKQTMKDELFKKVVADYCDMGGGDVALTPSVGDVFLDKKLVNRIRHLKEQPKIKSIGFVTNAGNAGVFSDEDLAFIVNSCTRINISVYGLDEEETAAMTRRTGQYQKIR